jgi:hypothetical protein
MSLPAPYYPIPLVTLATDASFNPTLTLIDSSSNRISGEALLDVSGDFGILREVNYYVYQYTDASNNTFSFTLTDTIEWDVNNIVVYKNVVLSGDPGPIGNQIEAQITAITDIYDTEVDNAIIEDINNYLKQIDEHKTHGMGTLAEYTDLLALASDISGAITLSLDLSGLTELANAAEQYGDLFYQIEQKISGVTTVDSLAVLTKIRNELGRIAEMYDNLEALKISIQRTSTLKISSDIQTTADKLDLAYTQIANSLDYLKHFVGATGQSGNFNSTLAEMNAYDKSTIAAAKGALNLFKDLVDGQQSEITASNNTQVRNLKTSVNNFQNLVADMTSVKTLLANALAAAGGSPANHPGGSFSFTALP